MSVRLTLASIRERVQALSDDAPYRIAYEVKSILKEIDELDEELYAIEEREEKGE